MDKVKAQQKWWIINAEGQVLGRLSTKIANLLRGKGKTTFKKNEVCGDFVIVTNISKIKLTGNKMEGKLYRFHSGYVGEMKTFNAKTVLKRSPKVVLIRSVMGMLPKNKLRKIFLSKLKLYAGEVHPHECQKPELIKN